MKVCHFGELFVKVGLQFCKIQNKPSKDCLRVLKFCQSGENSPNLVTLEMRNLIAPLSLVRLKIPLSATRLNLIDQGD